MADEPGSDPQRDAEQQADGGGAVEALWFLDPQSPRWLDDQTRVPDPVWERLSDSLRQEAAARSARGQARSIFTATNRKRAARAGMEPDTSLGGPRTAVLRPRRNQWLVGSVAAGVALLAVGIVVQSVQSTRETPVVAAEAPQRGTAARSAQGPVGEPLVSTTMPSPARRVLASGTDYRPQTLRSQVVDLLQRIGARAPSDFAALPTNEQGTIGSTGFTATVPALRACITGLTRSDLSQALVVDRASFGGIDVGLVIIPQDFLTVLGGTKPTASASTPNGNVDIWVVEPDCSRLDPGVILHLLHEVSAR